MKQLFSVIMTLILFTFSSNTSAAYKGRVQIKKLFLGSYTSFAVNSAPSDTCSLYGRHFKFDSTTGPGKNMFAILIAAEMAGRDVDLWYSSSDQAGKNETNGCGSENLATIYSIGFSD
jgi:hypothetical protein